MAKRKHTQAFDRLLQEIVTFINQQSSQFMRWLLRTYIIMQRWQQQNAGFVLPTTVFMLMVVFLVVTAIMFRTFNRTEQVIREGQTQIVKNAATPAVDRAKSKIEYLFTVDVDTPDIPPEQLLETLLENDDKYTYPGETRVGATELGLVGVDGPVAVWKYQTDITGDNDPTDPQDLTTIYAIVSRSVRGEVSVYPDNPSTDSVKASAFVARNGPLMGEGANDPSCTRGSGGAVLPGWFEQGTAGVYKAFQVYAVSVPNALLSGSPTTNTSLATVQYQQDRRYSRLNKWGAWFRSDLDVYPGDPFNWNGAMYSHSNLFFAGGSGGTRQFRAFMISSPASCFFEPITNSVLQTPGQIISGRIRDGQFLGTANAQIHAWDTAVNSTAPTIVNFGNSVDSIESGGNPIDIAADPVRLHTENLVVPRREEGSTWQQEDDGVQNEDLAQRTNVQDAICAPYVDDTYRADNRYGPKPTYSKERRETFVEPQTGEEVERCVINDLPAGTQLGQPIDENAIPELNLTGDEPADPDIPDDVGLDGYWERRARHQGLRVIVGQRLELGNPFGWQGEEDPLYPADPDENPLPNRRNELRQYRTLRDNLAAVQVAAVYHHNHEDGYFPITFVASTTHPANQSTEEVSRDFRNSVGNFGLKTTGDGGSGIFGDTTFGDDANEILVDFFNGKGTNGWEFNVVPGNAQTQAAFEQAINGANDPLRIALENLAYFAGDPAGSFPPAPGNPVRPDPIMTMWGNFSNLRRTLDNFNTLSIADQSNLHTAAGMLGMLAYNITYLEDFDYAANTSQNLLDDLDDALETIEDKIEIDFDENAGTSVITVKDEDDNDVSSSEIEGNKPTPEAIIAALRTNEAEEEVLALAQMLQTKEQVKRDRLYGFADTPEIDEHEYEVTTTYTYAGVEYEAGETYVIGCDFKNPDDDDDQHYFGLGEPGTPTEEAEFLRLATALCPVQPKFPSLFYLFPTVDHAHAGNSNDDNEQPDTEPYIDSAIISGANPGATLYKVVNPADIALMPRPRTGAANARWQLPHNPNDTGTNNRIIAPDNQDYWTTIMDKSMFDGREMMNVRVLDVDLNLLRDNEVGDDSWLPSSGIVYAFREDAVREDMIAREVGNRMDVWANTDPPVAGPLNISTKPVDYYPDPDRRPYGFRLKNGRNLLRTGFASTDEENERGLTFVSDNPVYIQGHFNLHTNTNNATRNTIEEFNGTMPIGSDGTYTEANFYANRSDPNDRNDSFADFGQDRWRVSEIIGDAVNILSGRFCDGTIESGLFNDVRYSNCSDINSNSRASYQNSNMWSRLPSTTNEFLACENPFDPRPSGNNTQANSCLGPVKVFRNGQVAVRPSRTSTDTPTPYTSYRNFNDNNRNLTRAEETNINAVLVSGVVPSRANQGNGGFHNFPRLNEYWGGTTLGIQGSFLQLNFSTYATGPYDQDAWEPNQNPVSGGGSSGEYINFYIQSQGTSRTAPNRRWGYDVGLQFQPAGPASKRMVLPDNLRGEFYREPPANDPYICMLRRGLNYPCQ